MSVEELEGFVLGNPKRRQVVNVLMEEGPSQVDLIRNKKRIPKKIVESIVEELEEKGIVKDSGSGKFELTDIGEKIVARSKEFESM